MSAVLNDRDAILQAATVRIVNPKNAWINLQLSAPGFHVNAAGQADVSVVTVTADLIGLDDAVTFSVVGATLSNAAGRSVDVTYAGQTAILTAKVVSNGDEFKRSLVIPVLRDGGSGSTAYTWIKYADTANGSGLSDLPDGKSYIGLAHNKPTATEGTDPAAYSWSLIRGADGVGTKGDKGDTLYTWIKYSDYANGAGLYDTPGDSTQYIGIAVNKTTAVEGNDPAAYIWSRFRGADGVGTPGARGAGHYYATGSSWSDVVAQAACPGSTPVLNDVVTISSATYVMEKRWTGSAWVENGVVINGKLIAPDSILTSALAAEIIKAKHLSVGAVLASHILVSPSGGLNKDPNFADYAGSWSQTNAVVANAGGAAPAPTYLGSIPGAEAFTLTNELIPVDSTKTYLLSASVYADGGNDRNCTLLVNFYDSAGNRITNTGWGDANFSGHATSFRPAVGDWHPYRDGVFGAKSTAKKIPTNAKTCRIGVYLNGGGSSSTMMGVTALLLEEMVDSALVVKGGIKADNIDVQRLAAIVAFLGNVQLGPGGALWQGTNQYNVGEGVYIGANSSGEPVLFIGNANGAHIRWSKSEGLRVYQATQDSFGAWFSGSAGGSYPNNTVGSTGYGSLKAEYTGGMPTVTFRWILIERSRTGAVNPMRISNATSQTASFSGSGSNGSAEYEALCVITDGNQRSITIGQVINVNHGTPV